MDKLRGSGSQKEWQASCMFRPEGPEQRHPEGKLPPTDDRGNRNPTAWRESFHLLDVKNGFWHVKLEDELSYLTTFHTPFGRYRWKRMPLGISSAPEIFQRKMHELAQGSAGIEVVADDLLVVGFGDSYEEAARDDDKNLRTFLKRCEEQDMHLNPEKMKLRQDEVLFIGHLASAQGLGVDRSKVRAITEMPPPSDKLGVLSSTVPSEVSAQPLRHHQAFARYHAK